MVCQSADDSPIMLQIFLFMSYLCVSTIHMRLAHCAMRGGGGSCSKFLPTPCCISKGPQARRANFEDVISSSS